MRVFHAGGLDDMWLWGVGHLLRLRLELGVSHECCCVGPLLNICDGRQMRCMTKNPKNNMADYCYVHLS